MSDMVAAFRQAEQLVAMRRPLDALAALAPVLEAEADKPSVQLLAGRAYLGSAQLRRAEEAFRKVIELDPNDHYAHFALGRALQRQSRYTEARLELKLATAMHPVPEYQEALSEVNARIALNEDVD